MGVKATNPTIDTTKIRYSHPDQLGRVSNHLLHPQRKKLLLELIQLGGQVRLGLGLKFICLDLGLPMDSLSTTRDAPEFYHPGRSGVIRQGPKLVLARFGALRPGPVRVAGPVRRRLRPEDGGRQHEDEEENE